MTRTLLIIDVQEEYFAGGALPLWQAEETEARIVSAIGQARALGDKIVLVRHISAAKGGLFAPGSRGIALRPAILAAAGDAPIVTKHYPDSFQDTDLLEHLKRDSALLVCGMMTQNCVVFTALSRNADGFQAKVIGDLCTAPTEAVHRIALAALRSKIEVISAAEAFASAPPQAPLL